MVCLLGLGMRNFVCKDVSHVCYHKQKTVSHVEDSELSLILWCTLIISVSVGSRWVVATRVRFRIDAVVLTPLKVHFYGKQEDAELERS